MKNLSKLLILVLMLASCSLLAQDRASIELRANGAYPTQQLDDADLSLGFGFEGAVSYRFLPNLSAYAGWGWHRFTTDELLTNAETDVEETGYTFGLQYLHPIGNSALSYFVRGGGIYNHLELEDSDGALASDSGHGLGWQAGAGIGVPFGNSWMLLPSVKYSSLSRDFTIEGSKKTGNLNYIAVGVGISKSF